MRTVRGYILIIALALSLLLVAAGQAQSSNRAALVIRFDDANVETYCIEFDEAEISGLELLERSGVTIDAEDTGFGVTVCSLEETGCPSSNCFCECQGGECRYWSYWHQSEGEWRYAALGAQARSVSHGAVDGWSWGPGSVNEAIAPPDITFEDVCVAPESPAQTTTAVDVAEASDPAVTEAVATQQVVAAASPTMDAPDAGDSPATTPEEGGTSYVIFGAILLVLLAALGFTRLWGR